MSSWPDPNALRFHVLKDTRDIDVSQLPSAATFIHNISDLVPSMDRDEFVLHGFLPADNARFSDADVRQYVAHMRLLQSIKNQVDPNEELHHVIFEDVVNIMPEFMTKHLPLLVNLPENYDIAHIYVFPQQAWVFDSYSIYETLPKLKGVCAYAISPKGRKKIITDMHVMTDPYDVMVRKWGLQSYTVVNGIVEHIDPVGGIGPYTDF